MTHPIEMAYERAREKESYSVIKRRDHEGNERERGITVGGVKRKGCRVQGA